MSVSTISDVTYSDIDDYIRNKTLHQQNQFRRRYYNISGHSYSAIVVLNHIAERYNTAIKAASDTFSIMGAFFTTDDYQVICQHMIPFMKEVKGIDLQVCSENPKNFNIIHVRDDCLNVNEWPRLLFASPTTERFLTIKE